MKNIKKKGIELQIIFQETFFRYHIPHTLLMAAALNNIFLVNKRMRIQIKRRTGRKFIRYISQKRITRRRA